MKNIFLSAITVLITCSLLGQKTSFTPHVVYDDNNKVYAVKMSPSSFLKFIDSSGTFYDKHVTNGKDYIGKGHSARIVPAGQESKYETKAEAEALLDYWNLMVLQRKQKEVKPSHYSD